MKKIIKNKIDFADLLSPADIFRIACVDERQIKEKNKTNPVNLPGAIYSMIDTLKTLYDYSEEDAWKVVSEVGIPIGTHVDDHFNKNHEVVGCGYAMLVETRPDKVFAVESIKSIERLLVVTKLGGEVLHYIGSHAVKYAVINYRQGFSIDRDQLPKFGIFSCDVWAANYYASFIHQYDSRVNPTEVGKHIEKVFKATVGTLTSGEITDFVGIK